MKKGKNKMESTCGKKRVAGYNQFVKHVRRGKAVKVFLASDADFVFAENIRRELDGKGVELETRYSSKDLATMAGVDVPTAVITETE